MKKMVKRNKHKFNFLNISNKLAYTLIVVLTIILVALGVYAYGGSAPATMGHSAGELDLSGGVNGNALFNGDVGIGVSPSPYKLNVAGNINANGIYVNGANMFSDTGWTYSRCDNGDSDPWRTCHMYYRLKNGVYYVNGYTQLKQAQAGDWSTAGFLGYSTYPDVYFIAYSEAGVYVPGKLNAGYTTLQLRTDDTTRTYFFSLAYPVGN